MDERRTPQLDREFPGARRPARTRARLAGLALALGAGGGCQAYRERPLEPEEHAERWHARVPNRETLEAFLGRPVFGRAAATELDLADGLTLAEGRLVALALNPGLRLARLREGRAEASARYAGRWADPGLSFGALSIDDDVPDPWLLSLGLGVTLPTSGRVGAERRQAEAELAVRALATLEAEWDVWHEVGRAWLTWSAARVRVDETRRWLAEAGELATQARARAEAGELAGPEAALVEIDVARRRGELIELEGDASRSEQALRALLGLAPEAPVELRPELHPGPGFVAQPPEAARDRNASLQRLRAAYELAEADLRREVARQYPDLTLGPLVEQEQGQTRIGLSGGLPLPLWNRNRRAIAEARAARELARAAYETAYERLVGRIAGEAARAEALARRRADLEDVIVPLVDRSLRASAELVDLGEGSVLALVGGLERDYEVRMRVIEVRLGEALARSRLEQWTGPAAEPGAEADQGTRP